jgi:hypothetical protein
LQSTRVKYNTKHIKEDILKKTILITIILFIVTMAFADALSHVEKRSAFPQSTRTRTEVIAYQETFETGATDWTFSTGTGYPENIWHVATVADAPSPTHAMINQNAQNTYYPGMTNFLISPSITLPLSGAIRADFMMKGDFTDPSAPTSASVLDYWYWDISPNNGTTWYRMTNPYNSPTGTNYVFIDALTDWGFVTEGYTSLDGLISDYAGMTVKFRICFRSDADTPDGTGIMIDNFTIFNDVFLPAPTELTAEIVDQTVALNWMAPPSGYSTETITSTNSAWTSYVSDADGYAMKITNPFSSPLQLHSVNFMLYRANSSPIIGNPTIHVFANDNGMPGTQLVNVANVSNITNMQWKSVDITSHNVMIPANGAVFVGISNISDGGTSGQGLLCDSTSVNANSYTLFDGTWDLLGTAYNGLKNCALSGSYWVDDPFAPILSGFKVYHSISQTAPFTQIGSITNSSTISFLHTTPTIGFINYYYVTGLFEGYESEPSNVVSLDLIGLLYTEVLNDDGASDQNYNVGTSNSMAVKFVTNPQAEIHYAKVFINTVGTSALIVRVFDANGTDGLPGTQLLQFTAPITSLTQGWNTIPIPAANIVTDADGVFYVALVEYINASVFALDTSVSGNTWTKTGTAGAWTPLTTGNAMIRALVRFNDANDDLTEVTPISNLSNYPNPFSQSTEFTFNVQKAGTASLKVYNLKGQLVRELSNSILNKGSHKFNWDGTDNNGKSVALGVYFCKLEADGKSLTQKIVRIK